MVVPRVGGEVRAVHYALVSEEGVVRKKRTKKGQRMVTGGLQTGSGLQDYLIANDTQQPAPVVRAER